MLTLSPSQASLPWRRIALFGWVLIAAAKLVFFLLELRLDVIQIQSPCQGTDCNYNAISPAEVAVLEAWGLSTLVYASIVTGMSFLNVAVYWLLGGLILWRQGTTPIGLAVSLSLLVIPITLITDPDNLYTTYPRLLIPSLALSTIGNVFLLLFLYLFPNGHLYPRWAAIPMAGAILATLISRIQEFNFGRSGLATYWDSIYLLLTLLGVGFQVFRYLRGSTPVERQQTKWTLLGFFFLLLGFPVWLTFFGGIVDIPPGTPRLLGSLGGWLLTVLMTTVLPITLAIAILRYRLWDIDVIIRRTLVYGALTLTLALVYFGSVVLLQSLVTAVGGQQTAVVTVISTLVIAALFTPLRRRIQHGIDRRFFRKKYDAEKVVAAFSAGLREEVDLDDLQAQIVLVVEETLQPEMVGLWMQSASGERHPTSASLPTAK
jgi:hypothetical protein